MKVLIIGSGGREHALANSFARSKQVTELVVSPGNAGIALQHSCLKLGTNEDIVSYCISSGIDVVFIGPEQPIAEGLSDMLTEAGIFAVSPSRFAAQLESSKIFTKELMARCSIPTAGFRACKTLDEAMRAITEFSYPLVLKADGLAAGKGVVIAKNLDEAQQTIQDMFGAAHDDKEPKEDGKGIVVEEYLLGWEVSLFVVSDGWNFVSTLFAQDHKQIFDHDLGPNTGGMGAYAPVPEAEPYRKQIEDEIVEPTLKAMRDMGYPYQGILYCGLMITKQGPKVIEFNCRFGDPEAEVVLPLIESDIMDICLAIKNRQVCDLDIKYKQANALGVVLASHGYPGSYPVGIPIKINYDDIEGICFSGVSKDKETLVTAGGRVMCVVGMGSTLQEARMQAYNRVTEIEFSGKYHRTDIGLRSNNL